MKIRQGFVSNSSSSSFIIEVGKPYKNSAELAIDMIALREWENDDELISKINKRIQEQPEDKIPKNIFFYTCNEETFIVNDGKFLMVDTCNNHPWRAGVEGMMYPTDIYDRMSKDKYFNPLFEEWDYDIGFCWSKSLENFWLPEFDVDEAAPAGFCNYCEECHTQYFIIDREVKCPNWDQKVSLKQQNGIEN